MGSHPPPALFRTLPTMDAVRYPQRQTPLWDQKTQFSAAGVMLTDTFELSGIVLDEKHPLRHGHTPSWWRSSSSDWLMQVYKGLTPRSNSRQSHTGHPSFRAPCAAGRGCWGDHITAGSSLGPSPLPPRCGCQVHSNEHVMLISMSVSVSWSPSCSIGARGGKSEKTDHAWSESI